MVELIERLLQYDDVIAVSVGLSQEGPLLRLRVERLSGIETYFLPLFLLYRKGRLDLYDY